LLTVTVTYNYNQITLWPTIKVSLARFVTAVRGVSTEKSEFSITNLLSISNRELDEHRWKPPWSLVHVPGAVEGPHEGVGSLSAEGSGEIVQVQTPRHPADVVILSDVLDLLSKTLLVVVSDPLVAE